MNNHLQRLRDDQIKTKRQKQKNSRMSRLLIALVLFSFSLSCLIGVMVTIDPLTKKKPENEDAEAPGASAAIEDDDKWCLLLVNRDHYLPADFTVDLKKTGGIRVDYRIAEQLQYMLDDAEKAGIKLILCTGYRNVAEQRALYEEKCAAFLEQGYGEEAAEIYTRQTLQPPGASEHHTGLAIDFLTAGISELDESFAQSPAYRWLVENAANYGFIERYPADKSKETGILWEPWHYRYVGISNAKAISSMGICLEEYV